MDRVSTRLPDTRIMQVKPRERRRVRPSLRGTNRRRGTQELAHPLPPLVTHQHRIVPRDAEVVGEAVRFLGDSDLVRPRVPLDLEDPAPETKRDQRENEEAPILAAHFAAPMIAIPATSASQISSPAQSRVSRVTRRPPASRTTGGP